MTLRHSLPLFGVWSLIVYFGCSELREDHPQAVMERCEVCHDLPPQDSGSRMEIHFNHVINKSIGRNLKCWQCHLNCDPFIKPTIKTLDSVDKTSFDTIMDTMMVWAHDSLHRDGKHEVDIHDRQCQLCHDYQYCDECHQSPPNDASNPLSQRVHNVHVTRQEFRCDTCHKGYDAQDKRVPITFQRVGIWNRPMTTHDNGDTNIIFNARKKSGYPIEPTYDITSKTCENLYCHGAMTLGGKSRVMITDQMPQDSTKCGFCHNIDTLRLRGTTHIKGEHPSLFPDCLNCHPGFKLSTRATDKTKHRNGVLDTISGAECDACHTTPHVVVP